MSESIRITNDETIRACIDSLRYGDAIAVHTPAGGVRGRVVRMARARDGENGFDIWIENNERNA